MENTGQTTVNAKISQFFIFKVGDRVRMPEALKLSQGREVTQFRAGTRQPAFFGMDPPPLLLEQPVGEFPVLGHSSQRAVTIKLWEVGVVTLEFQWALREVTLGSIAQFTAELYALNDAELAARQLVETLVSKLRAAIENPSFTRHTGDDYVFVQVEAKEQPAPESAAEFTTRYGRQIAQILRQEGNAPLSNEVVQQVLAQGASVLDRDRVIIDWEGAFFVNGSEDVRRVIEVALVQLLELTYLNVVLDDRLSEARIMLEQPKRFREGTHVGRLRIDAALKLQAALSTINVLGDSTLYMVYELAARRFLLHSIASAIEKKLELLQHIHEAMEEKKQTRTTHRLELVVILLIFVEILFSVYEHFVLHR